MRMLKNHSQSTHVIITTYHVYANIHEYSNTSQKEISRTGRVVKSNKTSKLKHLEYYSWYRDVETAIPS